MHRQHRRSNKDICHETQEKNSEETNRHMSKPIDFHVKNKYLLFVCAASLFCLPVGRVQSSGLPFNVMFLDNPIYDCVSGLMTPFGRVSIAQKRNDQEGRDL